MAVIKQLSQFNDNWGTPFDFGADAINVDLDATNLKYEPEDNNLQDQIITLDSNLYNVNQNLTKVIDGVDIEDENKVTLKTLASSIKDINTNIANIRAADKDGIILRPTTTTTGRVANNNLTVFAQKYNGLYNFAHNASNYIKIVEYNIDTLTVIPANGNTVSGGNAYNSGTTSAYRFKLNPGSGWTALIPLYPQFTNGTGGINCSSVVAWRHYFQGGYFYIHLRNYASSQAKVKVFAKYLCIKTSIPGD